MAWTRWWYRVGKNAFLNQYQQDQLKNVACNVVVQTLQEKHFFIKSRRSFFVSDCPLFHPPVVTHPFCSPSCCRLLRCPEDVSHGGDDGQRRCLSTDSSKGAPGIKPRMVYVQNPFVWLINRWEFFLLRKLWDPNFNLTDFLKGCKQALCTITQHLAEENYDALRGLIAAKTLERLKEEILKEWDEKQRKSVKVTPDQVHVILPHKVHLRQRTESRTCDVDMILVAFKPAGHMRKIPMPKQSVGLLVEMAARFHRNYSEGRLPDWTVTHLHLTSRDVQIKDTNPKK